MGKPSRDKGKRGEREAAAEIARIWDVDAHRGQQFRGGSDSPDVLGLDGFHIEVKRSETFNPYKAIEQAVADAGDNIPMVLHRRNRKQWIAIVNLDDLPEVVALLRNIPRRGGVI